MKIAVLAGNKREFDNFMRQPAMGDTTEDCEYIYIDRVEKAMGYRFDDYKRIGNYYTNPQHYELEEIIKAHLSS